MWSAQAKLTVQPVPAAKADNPEDKKTEQAAADKAEDKAAAKSQK
jgi:hypothetical protein